MIGQSASRNSVLVFLASSPTEYLLIQNLLIKQLLQMIMEAGVSITQDKLEHYDITPAASFPQRRLSVSVDDG